VIELRRVLILAGVLFVVLAVAAGAFNLLALGATHRFSVRSSYAGIRSLEVDSGSGDVHLTGAPAGSPVVVVAHVTESFGALHRRALEPGPGILRLAYSCPRASVDCSVSYDVTVPAGVMVRANTGDGDVDATGLDSPQISLQSGNGGVNATLSQPAASLSASSGNGDLTLVVPDVSYAVHASSGNGTVSDGSLSIDPHSPRRIDASSGNGDVTITAAR
jgi:Putative adhesin